MPTKMLPIEDNKMTNNQDRMTTVYHNGVPVLISLEELQAAEEYDKLYRDDDEIERADRAYFRSGSIDQFQSPNFLNYL